MTTIAMTGGCIIGRRISTCADPGFLKLVEVLRGADVAFSHLEGTIADPDEPEVFPAAEAGWTWIRNPAFFAEELKWAGFGIVSHASNHCMDYMYGGLAATWRHLAAAGIPCAGTGISLSEARRPAILHTPKGRVALVSCSSSTPDWARASEPRRGDRARPGANQLRMIPVLGPEEARNVKALARQMGWWITEVGDGFMLNPAGLHNTVARYRTAPEPGVRIAADADDLAANLDAIRAAREQAEFVIFHIHNHEWEPREGLATPPGFIRDLAHRAIDAGADIFIAEGAHALLRGIEMYRGRPILYDPGDLFKDGNAKIRPLSEYYWVQGRNRMTGAQEIATAESRSHEDIGKLPVPANPPGGYNTGRVLAVLAALCVFDEKRRFVEMRIHPAKHLKTPDAFGLPSLQEGEAAREVIDYLAELSAPFGTRIAFRDGVGIVAA